jgi:flagellin-like protein
MEKKGVSPVVGTILLIAITVALAAIVAMLVSGLGGRGAPPSAMLGVTAKNTDPTSVMITISHEGGDDLIAADLEVQASDNTGAMHTVSMTTSGGGTTLTVGGKATGTYTYGAGPGGKAITVYVIHNPSKQKLFSNTRVIVAATHISLAWNQTTWTGGRTTPTVQVGTWDSSYDKYYVGENENAEAISPTFYSTASDGWVQQYAFDYASVHDADTGDVCDSDTVLDVGQYYGYDSADEYVVFRTSLFFDTSSIPDGATITNATLSLYRVAGEIDSHNFDVVVQNGQPTYPHDPLDANDYSYTHYSDNGGSINTGDMVYGHYNDIVLNSAGKSWINKTGTTKLCLRSSRDIDNIIPEDYEYATFCSNEEGTGYQPKLTITYAYGPVQLAPSYYENGMKMTGYNIAENAMANSNAKTDIRFTAQESKTVDNVRLYLRRVSTAPTYTYGIQADNGSGYPSGTYLDNAENTTQLPTSSGWVTIDIPNCALTAGTVYHIVVQYSSGTAPTNSRYVQVYRRMGHSYIIPYNGRLDENMNVLFYNATSWLVQNADAIYILDYTDGTYRGQPYTAGGSNTYLDIYGTRYLCEHFTVGDDRMLRTLGFYLGNTSSAPTDNLYIVLQDLTTSEDTTIATITASDIPNRLGSWVSVSPMVELFANHTYRLCMESPLCADTNRDYHVCYESASSSNPYLGLTYDGANSYMENSSDGGATWDSTSRLGADFCFYMDFREYHSSAYIESSIYDATTSVDWKNVIWNASTPTGTSIAVSARTGDTENSYDGSWSGWHVLENNVEDASLPDSRYIQYRIDLSTTDNVVTPTLYDITLNYLM